MTGDLNLLITGGCGFIGSNFINYYFPKQNINKLVNLVLNQIKDRQDTFTFPNAEVEDLIEQGR